jgi:hypothetical protein
MKQWEWKFLKSVQFWLIIAVTITTLASIWHTTANEPLKSDVKDARARITRLEADRDELVAEDKNLRQALDALEFALEVHTKASGLPIELDGHCYINCLDEP